MELYLYKEEEDIEFYERMNHCRRIFQKFFAAEAELRVRIPNNLLLTVQDDILVGNVSNETFFVIQEYLFDYLNTEWFPK
jgi:hypothetical protein